MKNQPPLSRASATAFAALMLVATSTFAQTVEEPKKEPAKDKAQDETVKLEEFTVTTGYRSPKSIDQIPGAIRLITPTEVSNTLLLTDDATAVLARTIPGYSGSTQAMQNTSENLRGRPPLRLFDGISQSTPIRDGSRNGTFVDMGIVDRIEVINGPSAAEGLGAAGGIINYISKTPTKEGSEATLSTRFASQSKPNSNSWKAGLVYANKTGNNDFLFAASQMDRDMAYDANGRLIGMGASGSLMDTTQNQFFLKAGHNFGPNNNQRVVLTLSRFRIDGKGNYIEQLGDRSKGITDTSVKISPPGGAAEFNEFDQYALSYNNRDLFGGALNVQVYRANQQMRFLVGAAYNGTTFVGDSDKQDPLIAPLGTLIDQSEINSQKKGVRSAWTRENIFNVNGLEANLGFDYLDEVTQQKLALTNRIYAPPMNYISKAPFAQLSYNLGPVTLSGGMRRENGDLKVKSFTTVYFRNRSFVTGGKLSYGANLPNAGVIVRLPQNFSVFGSYSRGFTLPNIGITLRNVSTPGTRVDNLLDLQAVIVENKEAGVSWRGSRGSVSASVYRSYSSFGSTLAVDPVTANYYVVRQPVEMKGGELSGEFAVTKTIKVTALYSHIRGKTASPTTGPLNVNLGVATVSPDKLNTSVSWKYSDKGSITLDSMSTVGRELNRGKAQYEKTHGSTLFNLTSSYSTPYGDFSIGIENLFNKFYILDWAQVDQFQNYFAGRGRTVSVSYSKKF